jgi:hypothetical protein
MNFFHCTEVVSGHAPFSEEACTCLGWKTRNRICFDKIHIKIVCEIIFFAIALMHYWSGLHREETQRMIDIGVNLMMKTAMRLVIRRTGRTIPMVVWTLVTLVEAVQRNVACSDRFCVRCAIYKPGPGFSFAQFLMEYLDQFL